MKDKNPYNASEVIRACAEHAWERHGSEFIEHGISSQCELQELILKTIEDPKTRAFTAQPQILEGQHTYREIYAALYLSERNQKNYEISIILNPNRDKSGKTHGGTCLIRGVEKDFFKRRARAEEKVIGIAPKIVTGGRNALRERESHQQPIDRKIDKWRSRQNLRKRKA